MAETPLLIAGLGNPGVGGLGAIRRRIEPSTSAAAGEAAGAGKLPRLEIEEYSHFGMVGRYTAGAANRGAPTAQRRSRARRR